MWYTNTKLDGSFLEFGKLVAHYGIVDSFNLIWKPVFFGTSEAWTIIGAFAAFELFLMRALPGNEFRGPITPAGHVPVYKANGVPAFLVTLATFFICSYGFDLFSPGIVYDNLGGLLGALNIISLVFCALLYVKGRFAPSSGDHGTTNNVIFDYYWGTELYPRVLGWDIKMFTNCRFGMMGWAMMIISYAAKQQQLYGLSDAMLVSVAIQLVYISKFFLWETGYLSSLDIMHDRAGFYICWGCLVWVPGIYTSPSMYLVSHPIHLGTPIALLIFGLGVACVLTNYAADVQRQRFRAVSGQCKIWGKDPVSILAHYTTENGEPKQSLLLASGWWGLARHFHYIPEIMGAFFWSLPALFDNFAPYFYVTFLTILLAHRALRDDARCAAKYGVYWAKYCELVPNKWVPRLFLGG